MHARAINPPQPWGRRLLLSFCFRLRFTLARREQTVRFKRACGLLANGAEIFL
jgi:hypothetical protein